MPTLSEKMAQEFEDRGISAETAARLGVFTGSAQRDESGKVTAVKPHAGGNIIVFPYFENGAVVNEKYRAKNAQGDRRIWQREGGKRTFYNADILDDDLLAEGRHPLIITEGEMDALTAIDCGFPHTVSVPDGSHLPPKKGDGDEMAKGDIREFEFLWNNRDRLKRIKRFIIAMDADEAGRHMANELVRRLSASRCMFVTYPEGCKDTNDVRQKHGPEGVAKMFNEAQNYPVRGLFRLDQYPEASEIATLSTGWEPLDRHFRVFAPSLVAITGIPSHGKSTWVTNLIINIAEAHGWRTAVFSPEMPVIPHLRDKMRRCAGRALVTDLIAGKRLDQIDRWIEDRFVFIDHDFDDPEDDVTLDWILEKAADAVLRYGIKCLVIDPWNEIEHSRRRDESMSEYVGRALRLLKKFARKYDLMVIVVAHPTKDVGKDGKNRVPTLYDIEFSAAWFNKPDIGIVIDRPDRARPETAVYVSKVRFDGTGEVGKVMMAFETETGRYVQLDESTAAKQVDEKAYRR
jgi:twinkle protein